MATVDDFRNGIDACARQALQAFPANKADRTSAFVASLCGWLGAAEPETAAILWGVLHPGAARPPAEDA